MPGPPRDPGPPFDPPRPRRQERVPGSWSVCAECGATAPDASLHWDWHQALTARLTALEAALTPPEQGSPPDAPVQ